MTVQTAVRILREEGFVRSRTGSGVYVRDQASLPAPRQHDHVLAGVAAFLFEMGHLKHLTRAGWALLGIPQPETVAEHCFRAGAVGIALAALEGADRSEERRVGKEASAWGRPGAGWKNM